MGRIRTEIFEAMEEWLCTGGGAQDALDDLQLFDAMSSFLDNPTDQVLYESPAFDDANVRQTWSAMEQSRQSLVIKFTAYTLRPTSRLATVLSKYDAHGSRMRSTNKEAPDIDHMDAEELVESLDGIANAAFNSVTDEVM